MADALQVKPCMKVTIDFSLKTTSPDGTVTEAPPGSCTFIYGVDVQYPSVEAALMNKKVGDRVSVYVPPEEIFGPYDPELVRELPRSDYKPERLKPGRIYREMRNRSLVEFLVRDVRDDVIVADFNRPGAGTYAEFHIEIKDICEASPKELRPSCAGGGSLQFFPNGRPVSEGAVNDSCRKSAADSA
uniref:peptidylprolyl isomerase n=1 Tax=Desulfacinum infernum TaxID=35837 RepID=A0A831ZXL9_9BACT